MQQKGLWTRILGLLTLLALVTACGNTGNTGNAGNAGTSPSASTSASNAASSSASASPAASSSTSASASSTAAPSASASSAASASPSGATSTGGSGATIRVGSKNFTEAVLMAEMYAQLLEANGFKVERKFNLGAESIAHQALLNNEIDLYPEYTSTGLLVILKQPQQSDPKQILDTVRSEYEKQFNLTWLEPSPFNDTNAFAMRKDRADELGIKTYSDMFAKADQLVIGGPPELFERPDGLKGLRNTYGDFQFKDQKQIDPGLLYQALEQGQADVTRAFSTDGRLSNPEFVMIQDDKGFYPIYQVAPVIRQDVLKANPQIAEILNKLATPALDEKTMAGLNAQVDIEGNEPAPVARKFLQQQGLIQ
jgi:osmoprotectant transport system substrate-binding protein